MASTTIGKTNTIIVAFRKFEPLSFKPTASSNDDASSSNDDSSGEDESSNEDGDHSNKDDPPRKQLSSGFGTPIVEDLYTKL